jgi:hypothetical protein
MIQKSKPKEITATREGVTLKATLNDQNEYNCEILNWEKIHPKANEIISVKWTCSEVVDTFHLFNLQVNYLHDHLDGGMRKPKGIIK